jgi:hypothetical protein
MMKRPILLAMGMLLSLGASAFAASVTVDFTFNTLSAGATDAQIQTYMDGVLSAAGCTGCTVTLPTTAVNVSGATNNTYLQGATTATTYDAGGHVVGPTINGTVVPQNLGDTTYATPTSAGTPPSTNNPTYDSYLSNVSNGETQVSNQMTLQFAGLTNETLTVNSFDYEIFPCAPGFENCPGSGTPDMTFEAGTNTTGVDSKVTSFGTGGTQDGVAPGAPGYTHSPNSGKTNTEASPQYLGTWTAGDSINAGSAGHVELDFIDWPAAIGVDNLDITITTTTTTTTTPVPEPAGIALFGTLVVLLTKKLRRG